MDQWGIGDAAGSSCRRLLPHSPGFVRSCAPSDYAFDFAATEKSVKPTVSISDELRIPSRLGSHTAVNTIEKRIHDDIAFDDSELGKKSLKPPSDLPHQNTADHGFMLCRVLANDKHAGCGIKSTAVKDGSPFDAKLTRRIN